MIFLFVLLFVLFVCNGTYCLLALLVEIAVICVVKPFIDLHTASIFNWWLAMCIWLKLQVLHRSRITSVIVEITCFPGRTWCQYKFKYVPEGMGITTINWSSQVVLDWKEKQVSHWFIVCLRLVCPSHAIILYSSYTYHPWSLLFWHFLG